jgi:DNA-binding Lrp family transcriptional regulator
MVLVAGAVFVSICAITAIMEIAMTTCVFVQLRCRPGKTYQVAQEIIAREIHSELYSTSGDFDLMLKLYIPKDQDIGKFLSDNLLDIKGIKRSLTTLTFKAF